jgi:glutamyl-tRNA reductase
MLQGVNIFCFAASYSVALGLETLRWLRPQRPFPHILIYGFALAGLVAQAIYLFAYALPLRGEATSLFFVSWVLGIFYLYGSIHHRRQAWGMFVLPVVLGLVLLGAFLSKLREYDRTAVSDVTTYDAWWIWTHVTLLLLGGVGLCVGFIASVMYLVQAYKLKHKALPAAGLPLMSLERLEKMIVHGVNWSFPLLTAGMLFGVALLRDAGLAWLDPLGPALGRVRLAVVSAAWAARARAAVRHLDHCRVRASDPGVRGGSGGAELAPVRGWFMMLRVIGANYRTAPMALRERLAFGRDTLPRALEELAVRFGCEAAILSTCNRVEVYIARLENEAAPDAELLTEFLAEFHKLPAEELQPAFYSYEGPAAAMHLFRVAGSLDSLVLGEGQISGQVKEAYDHAQQALTAGPILHALFQHARVVAKRIRSETGVAEGKVSVPSLAMDYVRQVFSVFDDKTVLIIGAGKMGELTLTHLRTLRPKRILVTNRSPEKAEQIAAGCGGQAIPFAELDRGLIEADIVLSTTGAPEPIVTVERFQKLLPARQGRHVAIIDIAVPRDFDERIAKLEPVDLLLNVDDLNAVRDQVLKGRLKHLSAAEAIVDGEVQAFFADWSRRSTGPAIAKLCRDWDAIRREVEAQCFSKLNGKLGPAEKAIIEGAFRLLQNKYLHAPIAALREEAHKGAGSRLLEAIYRLFGLQG